MKPLLKLFSFFALLAFFVGIMQPAVMTAQIKIQDKNKTQKPVQVTPKYNDVKLLRDKRELKTYMTPSGAVSVMDTKTATGSEGGPYTLKLIKNQPVKAFTSVVKTSKPLSGDDRCKIKVIESSGSDLNTFLFVKMDNVIFPGSVIDGSTVLNGTYRPWVKPMNPVTLFTPDLPFEDINNAVVVVENPSSSSVNEALLGMRSQKLKGNVPAQASSVEEEVFSMEDVKINLKVHASSLFGSASSMFSFNKSETSHTFLFSFDQVYYTVYVDPKENPADFFKTNVNIPANLMYISSVSYGRRGVLVIQLHDVDAQTALNFKGSFNALVASGSIQLDAQTREIIKKSTIKGFFFGGNPDKAFEAIAGGTPLQVIDNFNKYLTNGANYSVYNPGLPISFTLRSVNDNGLCGIEQNSTQNVTKCYDQVFRVSLNKIWLNEAGDGDDGGDCEELFGRITVHLSTPDRPVSCNTFVKNEKADNELKYEERFIDKECKGGVPPLATSGADNYLFYWTHNNFLKLCERQLITYTKNDGYFRDFPVKYTDEVNNTFFVIRGDVTEWDGDHDDSDRQIGLPNDLERRITVKDVLKAPGKRLEVTQRFTGANNNNYQKVGLVTFYYTIEAMPVSDYQNDVHY